MIERRKKWMDKRVYVAPEMEITEFEAEDVIMTSGFTPDPDEGGLW